MKLVLTKSFFNRPVQPTIILDRDDGFVPTEGVIEEIEPVVEVVNRRREKVRKVTKTVFIVLGVSIFIMLGYYFFRDFLKPNFYSY